MEAIYGQEFEPVFLSWLNSMGLAFDPFAVLDAGADPDIPAYLVGHADFDKLWGDWPSFVFAPAGGGKTAFRVRLARACRIGEDGRRVFPIIYHRLPAPDDIDTETQGRDIHLKNIIRQAAQELLFWLAYRPFELDELDLETRVVLRSFLEAHLPSPLDDYLARLRDWGDLSPLAREFDRTAGYLINPPGPKDLERFCNRIEATPISLLAPRSPLQWLDELIRLLRGPLRFESVYILVDGVDAYPETITRPEAALRILDWLLKNTLDWSAQKIFAKFFLPIELVSGTKLAGRAPMPGDWAAWEPPSAEFRTGNELETLLGQQEPGLLTSPTKVAIIQWTEDALVEVIRRRLSVASRGLFDSLDAMSSPALRGAEKKLARTARPPVPREVLVLAERLLVKHVQGPRAQGKLEPQDLESACKWYVGQAPARPG